MKLEEFNAKVAELKAEGAKLAQAGKLEEAEAKKKEIEALEASFQAEKEAQAEENAINKGSAVQVDMQNEQKLGEENIMEKVFDASSVEYKNAFLKHISGRDDQMTKMENAAFVHTTSNTPDVLPTTMLNQIWDLVSKNHVIAGDITQYKTGTILEVVKHTAIVKGAAGTVNENAAPANDEQNTFVKVTLSGKDFAKTVEISYAEAEMSIEALEGYLVQEIATSMGEAIADDIITTLKATGAGTNGIAVANRVETKTVSKMVFADIAGAFALVKRANNMTVYCTRATLFNRLAQLEDTAGHLIYQPSATVGVPGTLLGAPVKIEDSLNDDEILIGDPKRIVSNVINDIMVETDKDIKVHKYIYSGYARMECALVDPESMALLTVKTSS